MRSIGITSKYKVILRSMIPRGFRKRPSSEAKCPLKGTAAQAWDCKQSYKPHGSKRLKTRYRYRYFVLTFALTHKTPDRC